MNFALLDWAILLVVYIAIVTAVPLTRRYMRSVADFLAAGRTAGRYLITVSNGLAALGAISVVAFLEQNYVAGFPLAWWGLTMALVVLVVTASGWVYYRFRETRCLTLAEFLERRYSKRFRIFAGMLAFFSGIVNFGIFPAVGARFFIHYVGMPAALPVLGVDVPTFPVTMLVLLCTALYLVFSGGQVAVIVTDFFQGIFSSLVFVALAAYLLMVVRWDQISEALAGAPRNQSLVNPFETGQVEDFNLWFFLIGVLIYVYGAMSWQGTQAYNASARSAHEAKMGQMLSNWRNLPQNLFLLVAPVVAYTVLHHADFALLAAEVRDSLTGAGSEAIRNQLRVPAVLASLLPVGFVGALAAVMLAAFVSTHDTYLHSWGSIFVQDVLIPLRGRPLDTEQHLRALKGAMVGVAVFIFLFSLLFQQSEYIFLFFAVTGAIFFGGSGAVLIGGLYWSRGTTAAAWAAMLSGSSIAVGGIVAQQVWADFPLNGQVMGAIAIGAASTLYVAISLLGGGKAFDLDRLLHRGAHADGQGPSALASASARGPRLLFMDGQFSRADRIIYFATYAWIASWVLVFLVGTAYNLVRPAEDGVWMSFWRIYVWVHLAAAIGVVAWFGVGGLRDVRAMLTDLSHMRRNELDDGVVREADLLDAGVIFGTGFAPFRGGPINYARERGIDEVVARLTELAAAHGERFTPHTGWSNL